MWAPGIAGPYLFDDFATPLGDPASRSLSAWARSLSATLRPVTKLTYAAEASAGLTAAPAARRSVSIALHATAGVLLFLLAARMEPRLGHWGAALLAAIWVVHPVHADSVLVVSGRTALLSTLFLFSALLTSEARRHLAAAALFLLACLSRETALAGALPLMALMATRDGESLRGRVVACASIGVASATAVLWFVTTPRYLDLAEYSFLGRPVLKSAYAQVGAVPVGIGLLVRPSGLSADYGIPLPADPRDAVFLLGIVLYVTAAVGIALLWRRSRTAAVGLAIWVASLLPTQSMIPKLDALANRPLSLSLAGLLLALAPAFAWGCMHRPGRLGAVRVRTVGGIAAASALIVALAVATGQRAALYRSELALWEDAAAKSRVNARPHLQYAMLLKRQGRDREAWGRAFDRARDRSVQPSDCRSIERLSTEKGRAMRRALVIGGILAACWAAPIGGETVDCIADYRCQEGQSRFETCCKAPPCQFSAYLEFMRAKQRMTSGDRPDKALKAAKGDHAKAIAAIQAEVSNEGRTIKSRGECKMGQQPYAIPTFRLKACEIEVFTQGAGWSKVANPLSLTEGRPECNEMAEAAYAEMSVRQELCVGAVPGNVGWWAARERAGAQKTIDALVHHFQRWWAACSGPDVPPDVRSQLEEAGITMKDPNPAVEKALEDALKSLKQRSGPKPSVRSSSSGGR